jgi:putative ABC transport system permease protein
VEGHPTPAVESLRDTSQMTITTDYFLALDIRLEKGRTFEWADREHTKPVAIVNEALARRYFRDENPVGRHIRPFQPGNANNPWLTVVGVVANEKR